MGSRPIVPGASVLPGPCLGVVWNVPHNIYKAILPGPGVGPGPGERQCEYTIRNAGLDPILEWWHH